MTLHLVNWKIWSNTDFQYIFSLLHILNLYMYKKYGTGI